jgi:hypothetical protein
LYERAIADLPLIHTLWVDYIDYIAVTIKEADYILETCKRSVANCSWSADLWTTYLIQAETYNQSHEKITGILYILLFTKKLLIFFLKIFYDHYLYLLSVFYSKSTIEI